MTQGRRVEPGRLRDPETGRWNVKEILHYARGWIAVLVALAVVFGGLWWAGNRAWDAWMGFRTADDYMGAGVADIQVSIPRGSTMRQIGSLLQENDVIKDADTFVRVANSRPDEAAQVQAGTYLMRTQISARTAFERLLDPANVVRNMIQLREGQRLTEQVALLSELTGIPAEQFEAALQDPASLGIPEWSGGNPEGFLFPDTYELPDEPDAASVLTLATAQFNRVTEEIDFVARAEDSPAGDAYRALIMASLLEREANRQEDRLKVARVFYNRLEEGMPLQSDATVAYANNITGRVWTTVEERQLDSPYNTYLDKNAGKLPPGPVTSPSRAALEAALTPEDGDWLYFVPINLDTGETEFNTTLDGHNASVAKLQEWCLTSDKC